MKLSSSTYCYGENEKAAERSSLTQLVGLFNLDGRLIVAKINQNLQGILGAIFHAFHTKDALCTIFSFP